VRSREGRSCVLRGTESGRLERDPTFTLTYSHESARAGHERKSDFGRSSTIAFFQRHEYSRYLA
jgi:hypothetical protein